MTKSEMEDKINAAFKSVMLREAAEREEQENEDAYDRAQERLRETGGPDDSSYRKQMIDAGRGHLLKG